jgi:Fe-S oxidoreductase
MRGKSDRSTQAHETIDCLLLSDPFTEYYYPEAGVAALEILQALGLRVRVLPVLGAGRTMLSKGFLSAAHRQAAHLLQAVEKLDPQGRLPLIGIEPSEIYTLRDEYLNLFPDDARVLELASRAWMIDEFLVRPGPDGQARIQKLSSVRHTSGLQKVLLHGHCYQKAQSPRPDGFPVGAAATQKMLEMSGYQVALLETGCCGMAGAFGYEAEHYDISMRVGGLSLFPAINDVISAEDVIIAASGVSCQAQIEDGTGAPAIHPILLVNRS